MYRIIMLSLISLTIQAQTKLSLEDCINLAIKNNFQIRQADMQVELGINQLNQSKTSQLPTVNSFIGQGLNLGRTIDPYSNDIVTNQIGTNNLGLRADWTVFNGFQNKRQIELQNLQVKANQLDVETAKNNIKLNVILGYMQVLSSRELLEVSRTQANTTKLQVEKVEKLVKLTVLPESNLYDIKAQLANDNFQITSTQNNLRLAEMQLKQLMNIQPNIMIEFEAMPIEILNKDISQTEVFKIAELSFPAIKSAEIKQRIQDKNKEVISGLRLPTVTLSGGWGTSYSSAAKKPVIGTEIKEFATGQYINIGSNKIPVMQLSPDFSTTKINYFNQLGNNNNVSIGLNIRIPIFNSTQQKYKLVNATIQQKIAQIETENAKNQLFQSIEQAFINRDNAAEKYSSLQNQLISLEKAYQVAETKLASGLINPIDFSITKTNLDKAKANLVQAKYEYFFRLRILDFYQYKQ
jgi:outer membrane protein